MDLEDDLPPDGGESAAPETDATDTIDDSGGDSGGDTPPSLEDLAGEMGWRPQDQWRGDPEKWKPAHEFMRSTVDVNHKLTNRLKGLEEQVGNMARTSATLTEQALKKQREEWQALRKQAIAEGDEETVDRADEALRQLPRVEPTLPPETREFMDRNAWFGTDREATAWAEMRAGELARQGLGAARQLAVVEREAKDLFPELFPEPKAKAKAAPLNQPGNRGGKPAAKGFSAMPAEAQKAALDYEKRGICKREDYAKSYFEEQGE